MLSCFKEFLLRFFSVAGFTKGLSIFTDGFTAKEYGNDMVKNQVTFSTTDSAFGVHPCAFLAGQPDGAFVDLMTGLSNIGGIQRREAQNHASISGHAFFSTTGLIDASFDIGGSTVELFAANDAMQSFSPSSWAAMLPFDKTSGTGNASAFSATDFAPSTFKVVRRFVNDLSADDTGNFFATSFFPADNAKASAFIGTFAGTENLMLRRESKKDCATNKASFFNLGHDYQPCKTWVKTVKPSVKFDNNSVKSHCQINEAIPCQASDVVYSMRADEGVTTRACGNNNSPTSAHHHSNGEEIVCTAWTLTEHAEAGGKLSRDNKMDSGYDTLNVNPSTVFTAAEYEWRQYAENVTYSGREMRINMGNKERVFDLVRARVDNAVKSAANAMNRDMYSAGAVSNQIGGLQLLVADTPTNTVGGISAATYSWWANQTFSLAADADGAAIKLAIDKAYIALTRGTDKPDFILTDPDLYAAFEGSLQALQRYTSAREAEAGFETLRYKGADVFFDQVTDDLGNSVMPSGHIYLINTSYLKLRQHRDAEWTVAEDKFPVNQDSVVIPLLWMGNMTISNRKRQGVIIQAGGGGSDTDTTTSSDTTTTSE